MRFEPRTRRCKKTNFILFEFRTLGFRAKNLKMTWFEPRTLRCKKHNFLRIELTIFNQKKIRNWWDLNPGLLSRIKQKNQDFARIELTKFPTKFWSFFLTISPHFRGSCSLRTSTFILIAALLAWRAFWFYFFLLLLIFFLFNLFVFCILFLVIFHRIFLLHLSNGLSRWRNEKIHNGFSDSILLVVWLDVLYVKNCHGLLECR